MTGAAAMRKLVLLAGAPDAQTLDWSPSTLLSSFIEPIAAFLGAAASTASSSSSSPHLPPPLCLSSSSSSCGPAWRSLALETTHVPTGLSQDSYHYHDDDHDDNDDAWTAAPNAHVLLSQFHEHSLAMYQQELPSSDLVTRAGESQPESSLLTSLASLASFASADDAPAPAPPTKPPLHGNSNNNNNNQWLARLSDLGDIPCPSYLVAIQPQTMTVNIIVGIISISPPRQVRTRWGSTCELVEVVVGDETRSGFHITFWLPSTRHTGGPLDGLRVRDVVLMQNVALNVFMAKVYGSSLRNQYTKAHLLYRPRRDPDDQGGYYRSADLAASVPHHPQLAKVQRVHTWLVDFVGNPGHAAMSAGAAGAWDKPPPDTQ